MRTQTILGTTAPAFVALTLALSTGNAWAADDDDRVGEGVAEVVVPGFDLLHIEGALGNRSGLRFLLQTTAQQGEPLSTELDAAALDVVGYPADRRSIVDGHGGA